MATIKAIEGRSVHQIQSGQVIVDLTSVVKELVENSLDAGASKIDIRFKNHGIDSIEVQDDGNGIAPEDFASVALKHHTSKLSNFEDLNTLETFGFRGEALSSLCALAKVQIITARAQDGAVGKRLEFETSGKLKGTSVIAAQKGTTVTADDIFYGLPVRRKELEKHAKREWSKVLTFMYSYACIGINIRFSISNQPSKGKKTMAFSTKGNATVRENIADVFGAKTLTALIKLDLTLELALTGMRALSASQHPDSSQARKVYVEGHVSKPTFGEGRQTPDRQMFFVNSRPCLLPQISKVFNEVYKSFNHNQSPFILANLKMSTDTYDVNVSPDKKTIMLHDQTALLETLKTSLIDLFQDIDHTMPQSQLPAQKLPAYKAPTMSRNVSREIGGSPSAMDLADIDVDSRRISGDHVGDNRATGLIEGFAGRDTTMRHERKTSKAHTHDEPQQRRIINGPDFQAAISVTQGGTVSTDLEPISGEADAQREPERSESPRRSGVQRVDVEARLEAPRFYDDVFLGTPPRSGMVKRTTGNGSQIRTQRSTQRSFNHNDMLNNHSSSQEPIPSTFNSAPKVSSGPINDAFARMRPQRRSPEVTDITIGDTATRTVVSGNWSNKKRRIHTPKGQAMPQSTAGSVMSTQNLQSFAAPGSQLALSFDHSRQDEYSEHSDSDADAMLLDESPELSARTRHTVAHDSAVFDLSPETQQSATSLDTSMERDLGEMEETEEEKKRREDQVVAELIQEAESRPPQRMANSQRSAMCNGTVSKRKDMTYNLECALDSTYEVLEHAAHTIQCYDNQPPIGLDRPPISDTTNDIDAESKLSLTVNKSDFLKMLIVGQFNLGFILAVRLAEGEGTQDELFIVDQHAADEKFNYERLRRTVVLQNQPLVQPKVLDLTAVEEEVVTAHTEALKANGFEIDVEDNEDNMSGRVYRLLTLPTSYNKTFKLSDLEELMHLLSELSVESKEIPRPKKVQQMLAMRACRSSIMVGKTLTSKQMVKVVQNMGDMDKPWNCPHGRPTMRHLTSLSSWQSWQEYGPAVDDDDASTSDACTDWKKWLHDMS